MRLEFRCAGPWASREMISLVQVAEGYRVSVVSTGCYGERDEERTVSESVGRELAQFLAGLRIPPLATQPVGFDGFSCTLRVEDASCESSWTWWVECPEEWTPLGEVVDRLRAL